MRIVLALIAVFSIGARADVTLPAILTDHMVIQRNLPVHIWGKAAPGEPVAVTFRGEAKSTAADTIGRWSVYLAPAEAGGPHEITIKGANTVTLRDVLVGDVWVGSGQSNMDWTVARSVNGQAEVASAKYPNIRLFTVAKVVSDYPLDDVGSKGWTACSPETVPNFSAVAYYFGRHLNQQLNVPVGLIHSAWGGTPVDAWTSLGAISEDASLMPVFSDWARMTGGHAAAMARYQLQLRDWEAASAQAKAEGKAEPRKPGAPNGPGGPWTPAGLYNSMIAPLTPFPIKGAIWYQGESNASPRRSPIYARLFQTIIRDWRQAWGVGDFPFFFVQLANFKTSPESTWPELREAQLDTLALNNTGMAVTIDIGNPADIHPTNKQDVGLRLALAARAVAFGEKIEYSGPLFRQATQEGGVLRVW
ncbi:MAG TPA: sialate O-acetylesterase, partial [Bryobacteraceae bacterium]|nr:sialate O-acetylesterase [Bryobacteraceae bacterium]